MKENRMRVLSLFDGISVAQQALKELGIGVEAYYASEIDKYAIKITQHNHPGTIQLGDVNHINIPRNIDLLIGGSPCQDLSISKRNRQGLDGERSGLFWEYVRVLRVCQPRYFVLENVASMPREAKTFITAELGVEPIMIDAALVSAQMRKRLFWTNIPGITQPEDIGILLKDVIETDENKCAQYRRTYWRENNSGKVPTLTANMGTGGNNVPYVIGNKAYCLDDNYSKGASIEHSIKYSVRQMVECEGGYRKLTCVECERLQSLPDGYTDGVSNCQRYKALGNAFNCAVIKHILWFMK